MTPAGGNGMARAGSNGRLTLAVPSKGRMSQPALELCAAAGLAFETTDRSLLVPCLNAPVDLLLVRADDIPEYVQDMVVDAGVTGANIVVETGARVQERVELGFGRCSLEAAVPVDAPQLVLEDLAGLRVATTFPVTTRARLPVAVELIQVAGSVEAAPRLGLADAIVDLVSTGSTMGANGLRRIGKLLDSQAVLIVNERASEEKAELLDRLELMLQGVVAARRRRYLMMNVHESQLAEVRAVLPSLGAPSVLDLMEPGMVAVHAAVDATDVWDLLPRLRAAGATGLLVVPIERLVA